MACRSFVGMQDVRLALQPSRDVRLQVAPPFRTCCWSHGDAESRSTCSIALGQFTVASQNSQQEPARGGRREAAGAASLPAHMHMLVAGMCCYVHLRELGDGSVVPTIMLHCELEQQTATAIACCGNLLPHRGFCRMTVSTQLDLGGYCEITLAQEL